LQLVAAAVLFSTSGAAIKFVSLGAWQVACLRAGVAAITLLVLLPEVRRRWTWPAALIGAAHAATMVSFVVANKLTTAASTIFLQSTAPLYILVAAPLVLREKVTRRDLVLAAVIAAGLALIITGEPAAQATAPDPARGNAIALCSGILWAGTLMGLRWSARGDAPQAGSAALVVLIGNVLACLATLPLALPLPAISTVDLLTLIYLGALQIGVAYILLTRAVRHVPAFEASLLLLVEPVLNPCWAWVLSGEIPGAAVLAGGGLILAATAWRTWAGARGADRAQASA
jgi:DME family drug/metabolite transporter